MVKKANFGKLSYNRALIWELLISKAKKCQQSNYVNNRLSNTPLNLLTNTKELNHNQKYKLGIQTWTTLENGQKLQINSDQI